MGTLKGTHRLMLGQLYSSNKNRLQDAYNRIRVNLSTCYDER